MEWSSELGEGFHAAWRAGQLLLPVITVCSAAALLLAVGYRMWGDTAFLRTLAFFYSFAAFGTTIGLFMGASRTEIVASVLPPVITLVSAYLAYSHTREMPLEFQRVLPGAVLSLLFSLVFSAFYMKFWYLSVLPGE